MMYVLPVVIHFHVFACCVHACQGVL